jgi:hypothetical protein
MPSFLVSIAPSQGTTGNPIPTTNLGTFRQLNTHLLPKNLLEKVMSTTSLRGEH